MDAQSHSGPSFQQQPQPQNYNRNSHHPNHHHHHHQDYANYPHNQQYPNNQYHPHRPQTQSQAESQFDILEWHPRYLSCVRYFAEVAQHSPAVQTTAAFVNILLPFQQPSPTPGSRDGSSPIIFQPITAASAIHRASAAGAAGPSRVGGSGSGAALGPGAGPSPGSGPGSAPATSSAAGRSSAAVVASPLMIGHVSLHPYIRRLVATGFDTPAMLHGWFGDDWVQGVGPLRESERRNYLFAAKSETWLSVKSSYDMGDGQVIPFLRPLRNVSEDEIQAAEADWSDWLAMQDWMLGPRSPHQPHSHQQEASSIRVKMEED